MRHGLEFDHLILGHFNFCHEAQAATLSAFLWYLTSYWSIAYSLILDPRRYMPLLRRLSGLPFVPSILLLLIERMSGHAEREKAGAGACVES
jgi:hypothetical protein